jgi:uncharacterized protein (TIGR03435 family)
MTFISILVKATLVLGAAAAFQIPLARRVSAATRHLVWTLAIAGVLLLPPLAISLPDWTPVEYTEPAGFLPVLGAGSAEPSAIDVPIAVPRPQSSIQRPFVLTMVVYVAVLVLLLMRVVLQHVWTHRLVRAATPITDTPWLQLLRQCTARIGVRRPVRLLRTTGNTMPAAAGIRQMSIVLPALADEWPEERRRAVLLHELAHVERHDCLTQTLAAVACAVYWVHPGVWWIARRLRAERELACDDRVLSVGEDAREYAEHLLELAASTLAHSALPAVAVTMARPRELEGRMLAVLDAARNRAIPALRNRVAGVVVLVGLTVPVAAATIAPRFHVLDAEDLRRATRGRFAQNAAPAAQRLAFEVASIKRTDPDDSRPGADFMTRPGGILIARNNEVSNFITNAYDVPNYTVIGGPEWMRVDRYNLEARADGERSRAEMMLMLQTLLADRFQFRMHRETRELPAYVLTVARGGAKLTRTKDGDCVARDPDKPTPPPTPLAPGEKPRPGCGNNNLSSRGATPPNIMWTAVGIDMARVTDALAIYFRRPVVNRTGLTGSFNIKLELPPLQPATIDGGAADAGVSVFTVLQEQLGLRVEEGRGPVNVLVVDRIERPTEN